MSRHALAERALQELHVAQLLDPAGGGGEGSGDGGRGPYASVLLHYGDATVGAALEFTHVRQPVSILQTHTRPHPCLPSLPFMVAHPRGSVGTTKPHRSMLLTVSYLTLSYLTLPYLTLPYLTHPTGLCF